MYRVSPQSYAQRTLWIRSRILNAEFNIRYGYTLEYPHRVMRSELCGFGIKSVEPTSSGLTYTSWPEVSHQRKHYVFLIEWTKVRIYKMHRPLRTFSNRRSKSLPTFFITCFPPNPCHQRSSFFPYT